MVPARERRISDGMVWAGLAGRQFLGLSYRRSGAVWPGPKSTGAKGALRETGLPAQPGARDGDRLVVPRPSGDLAGGAVLAGSQHAFRRGLPVTPPGALRNVPVVREPAERQHADQGGDGGERPGRSADERDPAAAPGDGLAAQAGTDRDYGGG